MKTKTAGKPSAIPDNIIHLERADSPPPVPILQWGDAFRETLSNGHQAIRFEMNMPADIYRALLIEATASGTSVFGICNVMLSLGIDRFIAEELEWTESNVPENTLRFPSAFEYEPASA